MVLFLSQNEKISKYLVAISYSHSKVGRMFQKTKRIKTKFQPKSQGETREAIHIFYAVNIDLTNDQSKKAS